jgi:HK97 family phage portal protein
MSLFDYIKKGFGKNNKYKRAETLGWQPAASYYTPSVSNVFETDVVQQVVWCITQEAKKLEPRHVIRKENGYKLINDNIQGVLDNPNELMTTADFIEKVVYNLLTTSNSYVLPTWEGNTLTSLYPLAPTNADFLRDEKDTLFIRFTFENGYESTLRYSDVIHIRHNFGINEFFGGNLEGLTDVKAIKKAAQLNETLLNGVQKSLDSSYAVNGIFKYNTMMDDGKTEKEIEKLTEKLKRNESGFMVMDLKGEFVPFSKDIKLVDEATLKFVDEKLLRFYGVSLSILKGDFTPEQYSAFYQKVLEPIIISLNQAFSKTLFTKRETVSFGHKVIFYHDKLDFMSMQDRKDIGGLLSSTGACSVDELRGIFGMAPCEDEDFGKKFIQSKNYGDAKVVMDQIAIEAGKENTEEPIKSTNNNDNENKLNDEAKNDE